ncbi:hypothetical protein AVEN_64142-1 [Araneus ventricosus]|uniref:Uncharacterized protein n=1 Tax=Araneus ventricosus TaxID=182803 RepID=A0A4Y2C4Z9_ARAVE|nr:hypothetical protein AVEN_64142-1 [Araneus ventricosus]
MCRSVEHVHHRDTETHSLRPDIAPSGFHLFRLLKKHLTGRHFRTDVVVQEAVDKRLHDLDHDFSYAGFDRLVYRWPKCFSNHVDCGKVICISAFLPLSISLIS